MIATISSISGGAWIKLTFASLTGLPEEVMKIINIHEAKTHLSRLVEGAAEGQSFVIAKAGKPVAKVVAMDAPMGEAVSRVGFLAGCIQVPDNFNAMGTEIEALFGVAAK